MHDVSSENVLKLPVPCVSHLGGLNNSNIYRYKSLSETILTTTPFFLKGGGTRQLKEYSGSLNYSSSQCTLPTTAWTSCRSVRR